MKKKISEVSIGDERIFLRNDYLGWHTVNPIKIDGKIVWKNLLAGGNWLKLIIIIFAVLILLGAIVEYTGLLQTANDCINQTIIPKINLMPQVVLP